MNYKVLVKLYVPEIEQNFELYLPINKTIYQVTELLVNIVSEITTGLYPVRAGRKLWDRFTGEMYDNKILVRKSTIRNGTEIVLF